MIKIGNLVLALREQLPLKRMIRNFIVTRNAWGMFSRNSHINQKTQTSKVTYNTIESARKASDSMIKKYGGKFRPYKCIFCDGYHIGKNRI